MADYRAICPQCGQVWETVIDDAFGDVTVSIAINCPGCGTPTIAQRVMMTEAEEAHYRYEEAHHRYMDALTDSLFTEMAPTVRRRRRAPWGQELKAQLPPKKPSHYLELDA